MTRFEKTRPLLTATAFLWGLAITLHLGLGFRAAVPVWGAAWATSFFIGLVWFTLPTVEGSVNRTKVSEAEARAIWLEGYRRACADFAGAPFTFPVVMDDKMEGRFQKWFRGDQDY